MNDTATEEIMDEIRELAATRKHRLAPHMLGTKPLTKVQADLVLAKLNACPVIPPTAEPQRPLAPEAALRNVPPLPLSAFREIPAGYYATPRPGTETIDYWLVEEGEGKWAGHKFARRVLGGQPTTARKLRSERMENMQQRLALQKITDYGLEEASNLFADTLTRCTDCSTPLTDEVSRAARKGPVCRTKTR